MMYEVFNLLHLVYKVYNDPLYVVTLWLTSGNPYIVPPHKQLPLEFPQAMQQFLDCQ